MEYIYEFKKHQNDLSPYVFYTDIKQNYLESYSEDADFKKLEPHLEELLKTMPFLDVMSAQNGIELDIQSACYDRYQKRKIFVTKIISEDGENVKKYQLCADLGLLKAKTTSFSYQTVILSMLTHELVHILRDNAHTIKDSKEEYLPRFVEKLVRKSGYGDIVKSSQSFDEQVWKNLSEFYAKIREPLYLNLETKDLEFKPEYNSPELKYKEICTRITLEQNDQIRKYMEEYYQLIFKENVNGQKSIEFNLPFLGQLNAMHFFFRAFNYYCEGVSQNRSLDFDQNAGGEPYKDFLKYQLKDVMSIWEKKHNLEHKPFLNQFYMAKYYSPMLEDSWNPTYYYLGTIKDAEVQYINMVKELKGLLDEKEFLNKKRLTTDLIRFKN
jgi:hypothetical protein